MNEALNAMVKAMAAEIARQAEERGDYVGEIMGDHPDAGLLVVDTAVDVEKVTRAALAAIRDWPGELPLDTWMVENSEDARQVWSHLIDAALTETPK